MAEAFTDRTRADRVFSTLHRNHLFLEKRMGGETSYQYHPLFREFLLARLDAAYSGKDLGKLRRKAAMILEEEGQHEAAIGQLCRAGCWEDAAHLIIKHAGSLVSQGRDKPFNPMAGKVSGYLAGKNSHAALLDGGMPPLHGPFRRSILL